MDEGVPGSIGTARPVQLASVIVPEIVGEVPEYSAGPETAEAKVVCVSAVWPKLAPAKPARITRSDAIRFMVRVFSFLLDFLELETSW